MRKLSIVLVIVFSHAYAQDDSMKFPSYDECVMSQGGYRNGSVQACSVTTKEYLDKAIEHELKMLKSKMSSEHFQIVMNSQSSWNKHVKDFCNAEGKFIGELNYEFCPMMESSRRLEVLKNWRETYFH